MGPGLVQKAIVPSSVGGREALSGPIRSLTTVGNWPQILAMAALLFEVWDDTDDGLLCLVAGEESEKLRRTLHPQARLVRTFLAGSHEDAMRQHYAAEGWGEYKSVLGVSDQPFSGEQEQEQRAYLDRRT